MYRNSEKKWLGIAKKKKKKRIEKHEFYFSAGCETFCWRIESHKTHFTRGFYSQVDLSFRF